MKSTSPSEASETEERSAGFVVYRRCGNGFQYLVLKHRVGGHWAFPKGHIELGEDALAAARRELAEESGIYNVDPISGFREVSRYGFARNGRSISKIVTYFLAETDGETVRLSAEHTAAAWLAADDAKRRLTYEEGRRVLSQAEALLKQADKEGGGGTSE